MNNPYAVLGVPQDTSNLEIIKAVAIAMRSRQYSNGEIAEARAILSKPASRLAADFTFPIFPLMEIKPIKSTVKTSGLTVDQLDPNKYNSL